MENSSIDLKQLSQKIGLFDSGIGGVSILNELLACVGIKEYVYVADTAHLPYGEKSTEFLIERAKKITQFFKDQGITTVIVACHTSSVTSLEVLKKEFPEITFIDPLPLTVIHALAGTKNGRIAIMATQRSITTGVHKKMLLAQNSNVTVIEQPCPQFVPLIEGLADEQELVAAVEQYTDRVAAFGGDTLILGCTHYPFVQELIEKKLGKKINYVSGASVMKSLLGANGQCQEKSVDFYVSGDLNKMRLLLDRYLDQTKVERHALHKLPVEYR